MFTITNRAAIEAVYAAHAARPVAEVLREFYPDAVFDAAGRPHAPYDGYMDPLTDRTFRGGEFLPIDEEMRDEVGLSGRARGRRYVEFLDQHGATHTLYGTATQILHTKAEIRRQHYAALAAVSQPVGTVGERRDFVLTIVSNYYRDGLYGRQYMTNFVDAEGNVIRFVGAVDLGKPGAKVTLKATIKDHSEYEGVKQTIIARPTVAKI